MAYYPGKYLMTFAVSVDLSLDDLQRRQAMRALNKHFMKMEEIPLDVKCPIVLQDAASRVCRTVRGNVTVGVTYDGHLEVIYEH